MEILTELDKFEEELGELESLLKPSEAELSLVLNPSPVPDKLADTDKVAPSTLDTGDVHSKRHADVGMK